MTIKFPIAIVLFSCFGLLSLHSCKKEEVITNSETYEITFNNEFNLLEAKFAAFLTDENGTVAAFSWLPAKDTFRLKVPFSKATKYDCTVVKITFEELPGLPEKQVELTTYKDVAEGVTINLKNPESEVQTTVSFKLLGLNTLDSLILPEGEVKVKPHAGSGYFGQYVIEHSNNFWMMVKVNGEPNWRYKTFLDYAPTPNTQDIYINSMTALSQGPRSIKMPHKSKWRYHVDGVLDADNSKVMPLTNVFNEVEDLLAFDNTLSVYEPGNLSFSGYLIQAIGEKSGADNYVYEIDRYYTFIPTNIEEPDFAITPTLITDNKRIGVRCEGNIDAVMVTRTATAFPNIQWHVYLPVAEDGNVSHTLPDVPKELRLKYAPLANYDFNPGVQVRAEQYELLFGYQDILVKIFDNSNPYWKTRSGLAAIEKTF